MAQYYKLEFKDDKGHSSNQLKKYGVVFQYLLGKDDFDPSDRRDVQDLVSELMKFAEFEGANERDLSYQIGRLRKDELSRGLQLKV